MRGKSGFTLVEGLIVVMILGVMGAVALPRFDIFGRKSAYITARQIVSDLRYTRTLAVTSGTRHYLKLISSDGLSYDSYEIYKDAIATPVKIGVISDRTHKIKNCTATGFVNNEFKFSYLGIRADNNSDDGSITVVDESNKSYTIKVSATTGRAYIED